ncbi:hypothetical protein ILYODFUR_021131 [Ilyodon furcidens]|uniref:Uncharacterized protein n=1 Tax=Ilyodon furcidens TaxID=33524 RepID=A0ABV0UKR9_9TELE
MQLCEKVSDPLLEVPSNWIKTTLHYDAKNQPEGPLVHSGSSLFPCSCFDHAQHFWSWWFLCRKPINWADHKQVETLSGQLRPLKQCWLRREEPAQSSIYTIDRFTAVTLHYNHFKVRVCNITRYHARLVPENKMKCSFMRMFVGMCCMERP